MAGSQHEIRSNGLKCRSLDSESTTLQEGKAYSGLANMNPYFNAGRGKTIGETLEKRLLENGARSKLYH